MGKASKRLKRDPSESEEEFGSDDSDIDAAAASMGSDSEEEFSSEEDQHEGGDYNSKGSEEDEDDEEDEEDEDEEEDKSDQEQNKDAEMEQLEKEYLNLRNEEQNLLSNLRRHKDEDVLKGRAVKNQKALWDKTLELRFLLQKAFSNSNKLPKDPARSEFCTCNEAVDKAYADLISSSQEVLSTMLDLQEALLEKNPSIVQTSAEISARNYYEIPRDNKKPGNQDIISNGLDEECDNDWLRLHHMYQRIAPFRDNAVDKWQRKTLVNTGAAVLKGKLTAFNQDISNQVAGYMRDPSRMIKRMQLRQSSLGIMGEEPQQPYTKMEDGEENVDGDPELLDDSEFYQQLLKEFLESCNLGSSESVFYAMKRMQTKKRKVVDRRASKSRKIRYHVHEKIVNFMAPLPMTIPPMAPKLFENLFGRGN